MGSDSAYVVDVIKRSLDHHAFRDGVLSLVVVILRILYRHAQADRLREACARIERYLFRTDQDMRYLVAFLVQSDEINRIALYGIRHIFVVEHGRNGLYAFETVLGAYHLRLSIAEIESNELGVLLFRFFVHHLYWSDVSLGPANADVSDSFVRLEHGSAFRSADLEIDSVIAGDALAQIRQDRDVLRAYPARVDAFLAERHGQAAYTRLYDGKASFRQRLFACERHGNIAVGDVCHRIIIDDDEHPRRDGHQYSQHHIHDLPASRCHFFSVPFLTLNLESRPRSSSDWM